MSVRNISIIHETEDYIAVSKPSGMLTIPDRHDIAQQSLYSFLSAKFGKIFIVHRLDKDTSGLILFSKNENAHRYFSQLFEHRNIEKKYQGIIHGMMTPEDGSIDEPIAEHPARKGEMTVSKRGKPSVTDYRTIESYGLYSLLEFQIHTGRTHQIRLHAKWAGHPIVCDPIYGNGQPIYLSSFKKKFRLSEKEEEERPLLNRLALHSYSLHFEEMDGKKVELLAPLPKDMRAVLQQLQKVRK